MWKTYTYPPGLTRALINYANAYKSLLFLFTCSVQQQHEVNNILLNQAPRI